MSFLLVSEETGKGGGGDTCQDHPWSPSGARFGALQDSRESVLSGQQRTQCIIDAKEYLVVPSSSLRP